MFEKGIIESTFQQKAMVRIQKNTSCAGCGSRGACQARNDQEMIVEVTNNLHAKPGNQVEISVPTGTLLKLSIIVYFLPIIALMIGAYGGGIWAESLHMAPTVSSVVVGAFAMGFTFYLLKRYDKFVRKKGQYLPRMTRILPNVAPLQSDDNR